jgi:hypothetical protein
MAWSKMGRQQMGSFYEPRGPFASLLHAMQKKGTA